MAKGSIRPRGTGFEVRVYSHYDTLARKRRYLSASAPTMKQAERERARLLVEADRANAAPSSRSVLVSDLLAEWLDFQLGRADASPWFLAEATRIAHRILIPGLGHMRLRRLTPGLLTTFYADFQKNGRQRGEGPLAAGYVKKVAGVMSSALSYAVAPAGYLAHNPQRAARVPSPGSTSVNAPDLGDINGRLMKVARASQSVHAVLLTRLALATGMRRSELGALRWEHIDFAQSALRVSGALAIGANGSERRERTKSTNGLRGVALDSGTMALLAARRDCAEGRWLFPGRDNLDRPVRPESLTRLTKTLLRRAGLSEHHLHSLRHGHATALLGSGMPVRDVAARLGDSAAVVLAVYGHPTSANDRIAAQEMGNLLADGDDHKGLGIGEV